jgi:isoleucyl-tRNA synthetase
VLGSLEDLAKENQEKYKNTYYIMRHGGAKSNKENYYDDGSDLNNHLTEDGVAQVKVVAEELKGSGITKIFNSPIIRTEETANIISGVLNIQSTQGNTLRESDDRDIHGIIDVEKRMQSFIEKCEAEYEGEVILIITHMAPARELFKQNGIYGVNLKNAEYRVLPSGKLPRDESGLINLHKPYIDKIILKDSKGEDMRIIGDVFDCWFESGSMPYAQIHYPFENKELFDNNFPADFIAEGMDQTRGWFYSLINLGVGLFDRAPFKNVIVNGIVLAGDGQKMSKSLKNYTDPMLLVEKYGADAIRFALMNSPVMRGESVAFGDDVVEEV